MNQPEQTPFKKPKETKVILATTIEPGVQRQVADLAALRDWTMSKTGAFLIRLGLEKLEEIAEQFAPHLNAQRRK